MKKFLYLFIVWIVSLHPFKSIEGTPLTINLIALKNGFGLEADQKILGGALESMGHQVHYKSWEEMAGDNGQTHVDVNIFFEHLVLEAFRYATLNWFIPNPEWCGEVIESFNHLDLILCRTREVERIFRDLDKPTYFLGFTSFDCYVPHISKDYTHFFHLVGGSFQKGTDTVLSIWKRRKDFPLLSILKNSAPPKRLRSNIEWISNRLDEPTLRLYQNQCGVHICISETEGFGHSIMEAMSAGAVVITTNAPPMNEFIRDARCLIPFDRTEQKWLATNYYASLLHLEFTISYILHVMSPEQLMQIGYNNRQMYLHKTAEFKNNLEYLLLKTGTDLKGK